MHLALVIGIFVCAVLVFVWTPKEVNESFLLLIILGIMFTFRECYMVLEITILFSHFFTLVYKSYTWAIVRSHHKQIREEGYNLQFE